MPFTELWKTGRRAMMVMMSETGKERATVIVVQLSWSKHTRHSEKRTQDLEADKFR